MILHGASDVQLDFFGKHLVVEVSKGQLTSDAGLLPFRQLDERIGLTRRLADRSPDEAPLASQPTLSRFENSVSVRDLKRLADAKPRSEERRELIDRVPPVVQPDFSREYAGSTS